MKRCDCGCTDWCKTQNPPKEPEHRPAKAKGETKPAEAGSAREAKRP